MQSIDRLVTSFLDLEASKSEFKKELARMIKILPSDVTDVWLESHYDGILHQYLCVSFSEKLSKDELEKIPFTYVTANGNLVFEVGDIIP